MTQTHQAGQSSSEFLFVCSALTLALFVGLSDSDSLLWQFIRGFKTAFLKFCVALSIPI